MTLSTALLLCLLCSWTSGQTDGARTIRQIPAPLPKLAVTTASPESLGRGQHQKLVLSVTNWDRYSADMFSLTGSGMLPPNPCSEATSRVVISIYSDRGELLSGCIPVSQAADLGKFTLRLPAKRTIPKSIYAVISDRYTGAVYRSNIVSVSSRGSK